MTRKHRTPEMSDLYLTELEQRRYARRKREKARRAAKQLELMQLIPENKICPVCRRLLFKRRQWAILEAGKRSADEFAGQVAVCLVCSRKTAGNHWARMRIIQVATVARDLEKQRREQCEQLEKAWRWELLQAEVAVEAIDNSETDDTLWSNDTEIGTDEIPTE